MFLTRCKKQQKIPAQSTRTLVNSNINRDQELMEDSHHSYLKTTIRQSKTLYPTLKYALGPMPRSLTQTSKPKIQMNIKFNNSRISVIFLG